MSTYHVGCAGVSSEHANAVSKIKNLAFKCKTCADAAPGANTLDLLRLDIRSEIEKGITCINSSINALRSELFEQIKGLQADITTISNRVDAVVSDIDAVNNRIDSVSNDIAEAANRVDSALIDVETVSDSLDAVNESLCAKISSVEIQNNAVQRRMNRSDIIISGLPAGLQNLAEPVIAIAKHFGVVVVKADILHCCLVHRKTAVLVKFNSIELRDKIMSEYISTCSLTLKDAIGGEIESRVYLNDHLTPIANKLNATCRKLLQSKKIKKFQLINADVPKAKITKLDNNVEVLSISECMALK